MQVTQPGGQTCNLQVMPPGGQILNRSMWSLGGTILCPNLWLVQTYNSEWSLQGFLFELKSKYGRFLVNHITIDFILLPSVSSMHIFTGGHVGHKQEGWAVESDHQFLDSLVVRISACHVEGSGSIPGRGEMFSLWQKALLLQVRLELTTPA